jgi:hypothetical protein
MSDKSLLVPIGRMVIIILCFIYFFKKKLFGAPFKW